LTDLIKIRPQVLDLGIAHEYNAVYIQRVLSSDVSRDSESLMCWLRRKQQCKSQKTVNVLHLEMCLSIVLFWLLLSVSAFAERIIYVDINANGLNNGSSWADAFNYLQDAISTATAGDKILVAQGIYKPDQGIGITLGDRRASFYLKNGVTI